MPRPAADDTAAQRPSSKLIAVLQSDAPPAEKAIACKQLAIYGSKDAVPALAPLWPTRSLPPGRGSPWRRFPTRPPTRRLREALGKLQGRLLVGVINSIGVRRDAKAVDGSGRAAEGRRCRRGLGRGRGPGPHRRRRGRARPWSKRWPTRRPRSARRWPKAASCAPNGCWPTGKAAEAVKLYDAVRKADVPKQRILEATRGAILAREPAGVPLLVEQLQSADKALFGLGLRVARELPGREVTEALVAELGKATPERQALLILALADRGDAAALPAVLAGGQERPGRGPRRGDPRARSGWATPRACRCCSRPRWTPTRNWRETAVAVLADLPGKDVDADLAARLAKAEGKARLVLIELAGRRRIAAAVPALLKAADDRRRARSAPRPSTALGRPSSSATCRC